MNPEKKIKELGIVLPLASPPAANYANAVRSGNLMFLAGKGPLPENGNLPKGKLGESFTVEEGYRFARSAGINLLAVILAELGSLDRVARIVEVQGFVNAIPEFEEHAKVLDGCSDLFAAVFEARGVHARSVLGVSSLRSGLPIVIKAILEVDASAPPAPAESH